LDIVPEPSGEGRKAIMAALEKARGPRDKLDDWWRAGVIENLGGTDGTSLVVEARWSFSQSKDGGSADSSAIRSE